MIMDTASLSPRLYICNNTSHIHIHDDEHGKSERIAVVKYNNT